MSRYVLVLLLLAVVLQLIFCSEQKVAKRAPKFGLKRFTSAAPSLHTTPSLKYGIPKNGVSTDPKKAVSNNILQRISTVDDPLSSIAQVLQRNAADVKKDLVLCYKTIAGAKDNYERIERTIDVMVSHKRSLAIGVICACGLYSKVAINPEKSALDTLKQARLHEISKWGKKLGGG